VTAERGLDELSTAIEQQVFGSSAAHRDWTVAINARHQACLERARDFLAAAKSAFDEKLSPEFIAEELRAALDAVGEVIGKADVENCSASSSAASASASRFAVVPCL
jgi:tRNA modification GTPase